MDGGGVEEASDVSRVLFTVRRNLHSWRKGGISREKEGETDIRWGCIYPFNSDKYLMQLKDIFGVDTRKAVCRNFKYSGVITHGSSKESPRILSIVS